MLAVIQVGLGPIGLNTVARCLERGDLRVVGAVDPHPEKVGRPLSSLCAANGIRLSPEAERRAQSVTVAPSLADALAAAPSPPHVALHTTSSFLDTVQGQLLELIAHKMHIVSTCEELAFPWWHHPREAEELDAAAKAAGVTVIGTGVNPGFAMDLLPAVLTGVSAAVQSVFVHRVVDAGKRRGPLQVKVGAGLTPEEFARKQATGRFGHIGLPESAAMLAHALGWKLAAIDTELKPKIATETRVTEHVRVEPGHVLGIDQLAVGRDADGTERIRLHLEMYVGAPDPRDEIVIEGTPRLHFTAAGGIPGDTATVSALINTLPRLSAAGPGLRTMLDLPAPRWNPAP